LTKNSVGEANGIISGDKIVGVNGACSLDPNGVKNANESIRKIHSQPTMLAVNRDDEIKLFNFNCNASNPSGLKIALWDQFEKWLLAIEPVAIVTGIQADSPAEDAGLEVNDRILWADKVTSAVGERAYVMAIQAFANNKNKEMIIYVKRNSALEQVVIIPKKWDGKGLTGMKIIKA